jgi:hypothetical protein
MLIEGAQWSDKKDSAGIQTGMTILTEGSDWKEV